MCVRARAYPENLKIRQQFATLGPAETPRRRSGFRVPTSKRNTSVVVGDKGDHPGSAGIRDFRNFLCYLYVQWRYLKLFLFCRFFNLAQDVYEIFFFFLLRVRFLIIFR